MTILSLAAATVLLSFTHAAHAVVVTCGGAGSVTVTPDAGNPTTLFSVVATCGGVTFNGTTTKVDTGAPSDLRVSGTWTKNTAVGTAETRVFNFSEAGYTLPAQGPAIAWHVLKGSMNLIGPVQAQRLASLAVAGTLNTVPTPGTSTGLRGGGGFNVIGPFTQVASQPQWTRTAAYTVNFTAGTGKGSVINFGSTGNNFFLPEPASLAIFGLGLAGIGFLRRRPAA